MAWKGNPLGWKKNQSQSLAPERHWQDGAGGLLLVAAAHETGLLAQLETAIAPCLTETSHPRLSPSLRSHRSLLLTLLFLNAVGLRRTRDLRGYTDYEGLESFTNVIKDYLLPLGLDTNHGYGKTPIVNSEIAKKRAALEKRLGNVERWAASARVRCARASSLYDRLWKQTKASGDDLYRKLNTHQDALCAQGVDDDERRAQIKAQKAVMDAQLEQRWQRVWRTYTKSSKESEKQERYAVVQCDLLRALEDLAAHERTMYELDNRKDQVMTVCKLALANLAMWTRDHYFPATYAHVTWARLAPFFQLPGVVVSTPHMVSVELHPFNDRQYNRDLLTVCQRVNERQARLPDGRLLVFSVKEACRPILHGQQRRIA